MFGYHLRRRSCTRSRGPIHPTHFLQIYLHYFEGLFTNLFWTETRTVFYHKSRLMRPFKRGPSENFPAFICLPADTSDHRVDKMLRLFSNRWNWDPPPPHPQANVPPVPVGGAPSLAGEGVGRSQFRRGDMHCGALYIYVLCASHVLCIRMLHAPQRGFPLFFRYPPVSLFQPWTVDSGHSLKGPGDVIIA